MAEVAVLPAHEATRRVTADRDLLAAAVHELPDDALIARYDVGAGPLGDSCESLRDLVAHVTMWDEISLAVLSEARLARRHWSLNPRWETREAGRRLNAAGVVAGRELPVTLVLHRFATVGDALVAELAGYAEEEWTAPIAADPDPPHSLGWLAQYVMTVPGAPAYWHAAIHLNKLATLDGASVSTALRST
jgi:DinB superfamily